MIDTTITGTDIGAIMGYNPYKTMYDVWVDKRDGRKEIIDNHAVDIGKHLEQYVAKYYEKRAIKTLDTINGAIICGLVKVRKNGKRYKKGFMTGLPDYFVKDVYGDKWLLEIKTSAFGWEEIPKEYELQCRWYMMLCNMDSCDLACYVVSNRTYQQHTIMRDPIIEEMMIRDATEFHDRYLIGGEEPFNPNTRIETNDVVHCDEIDKLFIARQTFKQLENEATEQKNRVEDKIKELIGKNKGAMGVQYKFTYSEQYKESTDYKKMIEDYGINVDLYKTAGKPFRVLRGSKV